MSDDKAFERTTSEWLEAGSDRTPPHAIEAVLLAIRTTPQERDLRIPWRTIPMPAALRVAALVAIVAVAGVVTINLLQPGPDAGVGGPPIASPAAASPTAASPTAAPIDTSAWVPYVSERYGFTIAYPGESWKVAPATRDWTFPKDAIEWFNPGTEIFSTSGTPGDVGVTAWSVDMDGKALEEWMVDYCSWAYQGNSCTEFEDAALPVQMDGHAGWLVQNNDETQAFIPVDGRMYSILVGRAEGDPSVLPYGGARRLLEAFLSTMRLEPTA